MYLEMSTLQAPKIIINPLVTALIFSMPQKVVILLQQCLF